MQLTINNPNTSQKCYWEIINEVMNKGKVVFYLDNCHISRYVEASMVTSNKLPTTDQYLSFLFVVKFLKKIYLLICTITLRHITLPKKQPEFRPGDSTTNQLTNWSV